MTSKVRANNREITQTLVSEVFRGIRTRLLYANRYASLKSLLVTSAWGGEGKSYVIAHTAIALAQTGKKVIILDCDLRKPVQHQFFGTSNKGISNYLYQECSLEEIVQDTGVANLRLIASGRMPVDPAEMLEGSKFTELLATVRRQSDYMLIDSPPVLPVSDACILGAKTDGIIFVVGVGTVRPEMALRAKNHLEESGGRIFGVIVNRADACAEQRAYHHYNEQHKMAN